MSGWLNTLRAVPRTRQALGENRSLDRWQRAQECYRMRLIECAAAGSSFYRSLWTRAGIDPRSAADPKNFARLPVLDSSAWRSVPPEEIMTVKPSAVPVWHRTGGTSGEPFRMPYLAGDDIRLRADVLAVLRRHGARWREKALWFLPPDTHSRGGSRLFGRVRMIDSDASTDERLAALRDGSEPVLRGYPWPVWRAVVKALRQGIALPKRRLFVTGGEPLPRCVRRTLERGLGARVVSRYAATDFGQMAAECAAGSLHVWSDARVEIVAGDAPAGPGEEGDVVATNGLSRARPLIRVRTGDRAAWSDSACPCGSGIPSLACVAGRTADCVSMPNGGRVNFVGIEQALGDLGDGLLGFQVEQTGPDRLLARLCVNADGMATDVIGQCLGRLFEGMRVEVDYTDEMETEVNGKTRVCRPLVKPA